MVFKAKVKYALLWVPEIISILLWPEVHRARFHLYRNLLHFLFPSPTLSLTNLNSDVKNIHITRITKPHCAELPGLYCSCGGLKVTAIQRQQLLQYLSSFQAINKFYFLFGFAWSFNKKEPLFCHGRVHLTPCSTHPSLSPLAPGAIPAPTPRRGGKEILNTLAQLHPSVHSKICSCTCIWDYLSLKRASNCEAPRRRMLHPCMSPLTHLLSLLAGDTRCSPTRGVDTGKIIFALHER